MARVRLYLDRAVPRHDYRFVLPGGASGTVEGLRLTVFARFLGQVADTPAGDKVAFLRCIVDTGAPLAVLPEDIWKHLRPGVVTPLPFDPAMPLAYRKLLIGGGRFDYDLGELTIPLVDQGGGSLPVRVVAKLLRDGGKLGVTPLLGLRGGVLDGRRLLAEPDPWAPFGQAWTLEDP